MRKHHHLIILLLAFIASSCLEEVPADNNNFVKLFGKESGSFGSTLLELPNGELLIGAKVDVPALDFTNVGGILDIGKSVEGSLAFIWLDNNGNQLDMNMFPIAEYDFIPQLELSDIANRSKILQVLPSLDGGFMVLGEWRGFDATLSLPDTTVQVINNPSSTAPFLMKINSNRTIDFIRSFNGDPGWDYTYKVSAKMKRLSDGTIGILQGFNIYDFDEGFKGYNFLNINDIGDTLYFKDYYEPQFNIKMMHDFVVNKNGDLCLIGQANDNLYFVFIEESDKDTEWGEFVDGSGMRPGFPNTNPMFLEQFNDGSFVAIYPNPGQKTKMAFISSSYEAGTSKNISILNDEYPRSVHITKSEEILVYTLHLSQTVIPEGYLYKFNRSGEMLFRVKLEGTPGDVIEYNDGSIMVLSNPLFNGLLPKTRLTKLSSDGKLF